MRIRSTGLEFEASKIADFLQVESQENDEIFEDDIARDELGEEDIADDDDSQEINMNTGEGSVLDVFLRICLY